MVTTPLNFQKTRTTQILCLENPKYPRKPEQPKVYAWKAQEFHEFFFQVFWGFPNSFRGFLESRRGGGQKSIFLIHKNALFS